MFLSSGSGKQKYTLTLAITFFFLITEPVISYRRPTHLSQKTSPSLVVITTGMWETTKQQPASHYRSGAIDLDAKGHNLCCTTVWPHCTPTSHTLTSRVCCRNVKCHAMVQNVQESNVSPQTHKWAWRRAWFCYWDCLKMWDKPVVLLLALDSMISCFCECIWVRVT